MVNKLAAERGIKVDFTDETAQGLVLCLSDIHPSNFIIDPEEKGVAIDFGCTGYLPPSFVCYALWQPRRFTNKVARLVGYWESPHLRAMSVAAQWLLLSGDNSCGT